MDQTTHMLGDRYELGTVLGRGGMAEVYLGRDSRLGRTVAIKVLRADMARDPSFQARFHREAQSAAGLNHPAIVAVYDTGEDVVASGGTLPLRLPYIVMEHVAGRTVRDLLQATGGGGLGAQRAVAITSGVLTALDYSHRHGIVHRDIKPANVMVTPTGEIKVMDFGIARAVADSSATMTQTSAVIGTAQYLSPEQAQGQVVDERTDLYSTGCLLYELLTGRPPFTGDSPVSLAYQHVREAPQPPSVHNPQVSDAFDRVVLTALAKDRDDRYPSAAAFREDLLAAEAGRPLHASPLVAEGEATRSLFPAAAGSWAAGAQAGRASAGGAHAAGRLVTDPHGRYGDGSSADLFAGAGIDDDVDHDLDADTGHRRRRWTVIAGVLVVVAALIGLGAWQLGAVLRQVTVPSVTGSSYQAAASTLDTAGLKAHRTDAAASAAAGTVTAQSVKGGAHASRGSVVDLTVSTGPSTVAVPDVSQMTETQAAAELGRVGLVEGSLTTKDDPGTPAGRMVATIPAAGTKVAPGTKIALVAASGRVTLPDLQGSSSADAVAALQKLQLVAFVTQQTSTKTPGTVISQSPAAGPIDAGSQVTLVVAVAAPSQAPTTAPTLAPTATPTTPTPEDSPTTPSPTDTTGAGADGDGDGATSSPTSTAAGQRLDPAQGGDPGEASDPSASSTGAGRGAGNG